MMFAEIVVSDDGSKLEHVTKLRELKSEFNFKLVLAPTNMGLGNNICFQSPVT